MGPRALATIAVVPSLHVEGYLGENEFGLDPRVPSQAESLTFYSALTYRFLRDSSGADSLLWIIRETRRPCGQVYYAPEGWSSMPRPLPD